jgi:hypothetical protein
MTLGEATQRYRCGDTVQLRPVHPEGHVLTIDTNKRYLQPALGAGIATGYGLDDRGVGVRVPVGSRYLFSPRRADGLWGPPSLLYNG